MGQTKHYEEVTRDGGRFWEALFFFSPMIKLHTTTDQNLHILVRFYIASLE